ncbi:MAG TPA: phosphate ABC transporter substrate-binding protein, partial [Paracoccus sp.]|nr:phosphate ABC transporter substrate-binding protein [Paracoccus sp. (in: a-proteobacteria)]
MSARAGLPMYDWPEERGAVDALWQMIRAQAGGDLPARLTRPRDDAALLAHWRDPALVFSQTCHGPLSLGMLPGLRVLAQPDYSDVPGGTGPLYRSAVIARTGASRPAPAGGPQ